MSLLFHSRFASVKKCIDRRICNVLLCVHVVTEDAGPVCLCVYISVRVCVGLLLSVFSPVGFHLVDRAERGEMPVSSEPGDSLWCHLLWSPQCVCLYLCVCFICTLCKFKSRPHVLAALSNLPFCCVCRWCTTPLPNASWALSNGFIGACWVPKTPVCSVIRG